ncbi:Signal peptidase-like protein [Emticicia sp. CRIBPO]|uniref:PSP1 domain-containing protein n=1 Tax=Emticicia sp. CRIBPO TaxID=2683258 RepID=UPI001412F9E7|nr:regulatory iron-sulfur-containing complex subunit RicT [Emticicia sp. CRIBPO]NBA87001.1 Signal peptidase-like protein [Emticicia sp. CRIBPO]
MGCGQCSSGGCGSIKAVNIGEKSNHVTVAGCSSKGGCGSGGCTKMNSFDWLSNMETPKSMRYNVVEIKFKGGRKEYFRNVHNLELYTGDFVVCEMASGYHIGTVSLQGELVRLQMIKKNIQDGSEVLSILRLANEKDLEKHSQAINRDLPTMYRTREISKQLGLQMKLSEVEYQSDNTKATFYYSADDRVDFRELIKLLAGEFKIRVEMRQISLRQEAARIGGIGSCGRELCCSTWLTDFKAIPTAAARYQNLSLNPTKLSGQCGRLKCCLNYELETYIDAIKDIPSVDRPLLTEKGEATVQKTDIFRRIMWFSYPNETNWYPIACSQVVEIQKMNQKGLKPVGLENLVQLVDVAPQSKSSSINNDLERLDKKFSDKRRSGGGGGGGNAENAGGNKSGNRNKRHNRNRNNNRNNNNPNNNANPK